MHILVVNDDGPPSPLASPYTQALVQTLQKNGHIVSVVLPTDQRSWIGKAHFIDKKLYPKYFVPGPLSFTEETGRVSSTPLPIDSEEEEWLLVDGTPASCTQVGLHHHFADRGPIDLVVSGPNYGRNSTAVFALSSGTIGGALEAAVCGHKAIAISYACEVKDGIHVPEIVMAATRLSVKIIEEVMKEGKWPQEAHILSVNVPLLPDVEDRAVFWTEMLQNAWIKGSSQFQEELLPVDPAPEGVCDSPKHEKLNKEEVMETAVIGVDAPSSDPSSKSGTTTTQYHQSPQAAQKHYRYVHKCLRWAPKMYEIRNTAKVPRPGTDGWTIEEGYTSITPLRANFMHAPNCTGELKFT